MTSPTKSSTQVDFFKPKTCLHVFFVIHSQIPYFYIKILAPLCSCQNNLQLWVFISTFHSICIGSSQNKLPRSPGYWICSFGEPVWGIEYCYTLAINGSNTYSYPRFRIVTRNCRSPPSSIDVLSYFRYENRHDYES